MTGESNISNDPSLSRYGGSTRSNEPAVWAFFSAGGVVSAFFLPAIALLLTGWFGGTWLADYAAVSKALSYVVVKVALVLFLLVCFIHATHRLRFVAADLGILRNSPTVVATILYALALAGTAFGAVALFGGGA